VENELKQMLQNGITKYRYDPNTYFNSPVVIVKKSAGGIRLVINFISLNERTVDDRYQMPNANELLSRVAGGKFITKIDLTSAFFQVELETNSQKYTGLQTPFGTFSYLRMFQGLKAAPSTCQRLMDFVLRGTHKYAGTLTDDTMVFSETFDKPLVHVRDILQRLRMAGSTANSK